MDSGLTADTQSIVENSRYNGIRSWKIATANSVEKPHTSTDVIAERVRAPATAKAPGIANGSRCQQPD